QVYFTLTESTDLIEAGEYEALVDANNGELLFVNKSGENILIPPIIILPPEDDAEYDATLKGIDLNGVEREISSYCLRDGSEYGYTYTHILKNRKKKIYLYRESLDNPVEYSFYTPVLLPDEVSAMYNMEKVYDFYKDKFNRKSFSTGFDNSPQPIKIILTNSMDNAEYKSSVATVFNNDSKFTFGVGDGIVTKSQSLAAGLDVVGHEFTHGVICSETSLENLETGVPATINEAYADIFGNYIDGSDWYIGEDVFVGGANSIYGRNISNPQKTNSPSKYSEITDFTCSDVHINSTLVSHAAYLMENDSEYSLNATHTKIMKIWYKSLQLGYASETDFYDVRLNVLQAAKKVIPPKTLGFIKNEENTEDIKNIGNIFNKMEIDKTCNLDSSYFDKLKSSGAASIKGFFTDFSTNISGKTFIADTDNNDNNSILANVNISINNSRNSETLFSIFSNEDGYYSQSGINYRDIEVGFSKIGYYAEKLYLPDTPVGSKIYPESVELIPTSYTGLGNAGGVIKDAVTTNGIEGLTLNLRKGINNKSYSEIISSTNTDNLGNFVFSSYSGNYTIEILDERVLSNETDRYKTQYLNIKILGGNTISNQNGVISKNLLSNQVRVVLTWGDYPRDLDSHLYGPSGNSTNNFHIYYVEKSYSYAGKTVAFLDVDDTSSYGPETTTVYNVINGIYTFSVYNFSGSPDIKSSNAKVQVYIGDSNIASYTFNVPKNGEGRNWNVFKYQSTTKTIVPINTIS
ncbi:MAG: M4 family metallopeptidase, partial [Oscillospiraceae bacterium]|nr:M4 family metallopeptidase [Oscillospiraceae bacterium]